MSQQATCQICGRAIKANTGVIAHHGYTRPHAYTQTSSCLGARHQPYEVAHDALDSYIAKLIDWLFLAQAALTDYVNAPPATITFQKQDAWGAKRGEPKIFERPSNFDTSRNPGSYRSDMYASCYWPQYNRFKANVAGLTADLAFCRERRAAWKEVAA